MNLLVSEVAPALRLGSDVGKQRFDVKKEASKRKVDAAEDVLRLLVREAVEAEELSASARRAVISIVEKQKGSAMGRCKLTLA